MKRFTFPVWVSLLLTSCIQIKISFAQINNGGESAPALFMAGQSALAKGDLTAAETAFRQALKLQPDSLPARANLGVVYMRRKDWPRALAEFRTAERLAPDNPGVEINIGLAYFRQGDYTSAIPPFQTVLKANPSSLQSRYLLGLCYFATEQYSDAANTLQPLWPQENEKMPYLYVLALSANKAANPALEREALERLYAVGGNSAQYHLFIGRAWLMRQQAANAVRELQEAVRLDRQLPFAHYSLGVAYTSLGKYAEAKSEFLLDRAIEPDLSYNYEEIAAICLKLDQPDEAEQNYLQAAKLNPRSASAYLGLAKIYKAKSQYRKALEELQAANQIDGQSASVHYLKAQILLQLNRPEEAKGEFAFSARLRQSTRDHLEEQVSGRSALDAQIGSVQ